MVLMRCGALPEGYGEYSSEEFGEFDVERLLATGADYVVYWYGSGCYCGSGHVIARKDGRWHHHDCSHCSCYGPTEGIDFSGDGHESVEALLAACSDELRDHLGPLVGIVPQSTTPY